MSLIMIGIEYTTMLANSTTVNISTMTSAMLRRPSFNLGEKAEISACSDFEPSRV